MKKRILVVDDTDYMREAVRETLVSAGFDVVEACDGANALEVLRDKPDSYFYAIVTDYQMPNLDGLGFLAEVINRNFPIEKVILSSGRISFDFQMVAKPYDPERLINSLKDGNT